MSRSSPSVDLGRADGAVFRCPTCAVWRIRPPYARVRHTCRTAREVARRIQRGEQACRD